MAKAAKNKLFNARAYMQLAIEEMNKSVTEFRVDGKIPPKVGSILVFPNGEVMRSHRGELREGDHAEYTLLERKLNDRKLNDCILFTTLEPCYQRNHPKIACCKRATNARIKTVYVGIEDPDPTVSGKGIAHLEKHGIDVHMFDRDLQKQIEKANRDFLNQAIERKQSFQQEEIISTIEQPVPSCSFYELSTEALQKFITGAKLPYAIDHPDFARYLTNSGILVHDKSINQFTPTGFGILLFGVDPRVTFKQASLKCSIDYGNGNIEAKEFDQPLVLVPDLIHEWIRKVLPSLKDTSSFKRKDISVFPVEVLREAVINALVHRDYGIEGARSYLQINYDKIVVKSPGAPVPAISLEQLNTFKAPSISRNPIITFIFNKMGYVEEMGFGMDALKSLQPQYELPLPQYDFEDPFLTLTFPRSLDAIKKAAQHAGLDKLNNEELSGYEYIKLQSKANRKQYELHFGFDKKKAERHLNKMVEEKLIERKGSGPGTYYQIIRV